MVGRGEVGEGGILVAGGEVVEVKASIYINGASPFSCHNPNRLDKRILIYRHDYTDKPLHNSHGYPLEQINL